MKCSIIAKSGHPNFLYQITSFSINFIKHKLIFKCLMYQNISEYLIKNLEKLEKAEKLKILQTKEEKK